MTWVEYYYKRACAIAALNPLLGENCAHDWHPIPKRFGQYCLHCGWQQ